MRLFVDVEETALASPLATYRYVGQFVDRVRALTGHRPVIYTFPSFWNVLGNRPNFGCPLWIAHFEVANPSIPQPWQKFAIWQHTSKGQVPGVAGNVDLNQATKLPLISASEPLPAPVPEPVPEPVLSKRQRLIARMRRAQRAFLATGANDALRVLLVCKARWGRLRRALPPLLRPADRRHRRRQALHHPSLRQRASSDVDHERCARTRQLSRPAQGGGHRSEDEPGRHHEGAPAHGALSTRRVQPPRQHPPSRTDRPDQRPGSPKRSADRTHRGTATRTTARQPRPRRILTAHAGQDEAVSAHTSTNAYSYARPHQKTSPPSQEEAPRRWADTAGAGTRSRHRSTARPQNAPPARTDGPEARRASGSQGSSRG